MPLDWSRYPNFAAREFACQETGECAMDADFLGRLQILRDCVGRPLVVASGYRSPRHSIEAAKAQPGAHAAGQAADMRCSGELAVAVLYHALRLEFRGIGVQQKGPHAGRYIHLDTWSQRKAPTVWSY